MGAYFFRRILIMIPTLVGITFLGYFVLSLAPGDAVTLRTSPASLNAMTQAQIGQRRHDLGLDAPIPVQYLHWVAGAIQGDFGYSTATRRPVVEEIAPRLGPSLMLMGPALFLAVLIGVPLGIFAALRQNRRSDYVATGVMLAVASTPTFLLGLVGIFVFGVGLRMLPVGGMITLGSPFTVPDFLGHLIMPAVILGLANAAILMRYTRASMLEVLGSDYLTTARAKGLAPLRILVVHAFKNALIPIIALVGLLSSDLIAGAVITEQVFAWPGMGQLAVRAAGDRDAALLMGIMLLVGAAVLVSSFLADLLSAYVDPRVRFDQ